MRPAPTTAPKGAPATAAMPVPNAAPPIAVFWGVLMLSHPPHKPIAASIRIIVVRTSSSNGQLQAAQRSGIVSDFRQSLSELNTNMPGLPAMPNGRCRMHGGPSLGAPKGNRNAWKHGRFSAEAIARRREVAGLLRAARALLNEDM